MADRTRKTNRFNYRGTNTRLVADAMPEGKFPMGYNVRADGDSKVRARPGYVGPFFTANVAPPPPPPPATGKIVPLGAWLINSRVGPFFRASTKALYMVMVDTRVGPTDERSLIALKSTDLGNTWTIVDDGVFPALTNPIDSFDCHRVPSSDTIHIATQENTTGRVAYHQFSLASDTWALLNEEVKSTNNYRQTPFDGNSGTNVCVSITVRSDTGQPTVVYVGDRTFVSGVAADPPLTPTDFYYNRAKLSRRTGVATWTAEVDMGDPSTAATSESPPFIGFPYQGQVHIQIGRLIAGLNDRVYFVHSRIEPADVASTADFEIQTLNTDNSLTSWTEFFTTQALDFSTGCPVGQPDTFLDGSGNFWIVAPMTKGIFAPQVFMWKDGVSVGLSDETGTICNTNIFADSFATLNPGADVKFVNNTLYALICLNQGALSTTWKAYKTIGFPTFSVTPAATTTDFQVGPTIPFGESVQRAGIEMAIIDGVVWMFIASSGFAPVGSSGFMFEGYDVVRDLPTPNSYTLSQWLIDHP